MARGAACVAAVLALAGCACALVRARLAPTPSAEEALLTRRVEGLRALIARGAGGRLVEPHEVTVVVHQDVVRDLLLAATPFERTIDGYRVRVESATAEFSDGFALVRLEARAEMLDGQVSGDVVVLGGLEVRGLAGSGLLHCEVRIFAVEARAANVAGLERPVRRLIDGFGREALDALISDVDIPVKVEDRLLIPGLDTGRVRIAAAVVPVQARVVEVSVFGDRLWVGISAAVGGAPARARS